MKNIKRLLIVFIVINLTSCNDTWNFTKPSNLIQEFYKTYSSYMEYYYDWFDKKSPEEEKKIEKELEERLDNLYLNRSTYLKVLENLKFEFSQQYDEFLYGILNTKILNINNKETKNNNEIWEATITTTHIIYSQFSSEKKFMKWFLPSHEKSIIEFQDFLDVFNEIEKLEQNKEFVGKGIVALVETEELHSFYIVKKGKKYKIKDIEYKLLKYKVDINK